MLLTKDFPKMKKADREFHDVELYRAIFDRAPVMQYALNTAQGVPYIVNTNYGYAFDEDGTLHIYLHLGKEGFKIDCMRADDRVCATVNLYRRFEEHGELGIHTFASVVAFGHIHLIDRKEDPMEFGKAMRALVDHTKTMGKLRVKSDETARLYTARIDCLPDDIYGKTEHPLTVDNIDERFGL